MKESIKQKEPKIKKEKEKKVKEKPIREKKTKLVKPHPKMEKAKKILKCLNTKRNRVIAIIVLVIIAFFVAKSIITKRIEKMSAFNVTATYETVDTGDITLSVAGDGNLNSGTTMTFSAITDLAIDQVLVSPGTVVKQGDVIATLDAEGMQQILSTLSYDLYDKQVTVDESDKVESTYYIKAPATGRLKDVQIEEEDMVEDAMADPGYLAIISTVDEMKIEVTEAEYKTLQQESFLVVRTESHKYVDDISLRMIDDKYYVILPTAMRTIGAEASVYSSTSTKVGNELATGNLELVDYVYLKDTYGEISYQDDFENYWVDKGEVLFHVDQFKHTLDQAYETLEETRDQYNACVGLTERLVLTAPYDGIIGELNISDGSTIAVDSTVAMMYSEDNWTATVAIDELDISDIAVGQTAVVTIDALDYGEFNATVSSISSSGVASGGITTYDVTLDVEDNDSFKLAMTLTCEIEVESADNVLLVSSSSVRTTGTFDYVLVKADRTAAEKAEIKKAILNNDMNVLSKYISITSGIDSASTDASADMNEQRGPVPSGMDMGDMPGGFNLENMPEDMGSEDTTDQAQGGGMRGMSFSLSNPVELLYGDIVIIESGLDDGTNTEIISGLIQGDQVLVPITASSDDDDSSGFSLNMFGAGGGGEMPAGGGQRPSGDMPAGGFSGGN